MMPPPVGAITLCSISRFARRHAHGWLSRSSEQSPSSLASFLEDLFGDDELHDLAGSLVDLRDLRVAIVALGGEVFQISVAPEDLHAVARGLDGDVTREKLRLCGGEDVVFSRVLQCRGTPGQKARRVDLGGYVRQHPLDRLEIGDLLSEGFTLLGVREGVLEAGARDPDRLGRDRNAAAIEGREGDAESLVRLAQQTRRGHPRILEDELCRVRSTDPELFLELAD